MEGTPGGLNFKLPKETKLFYNTTMTYKSGRDKYKSSNEKLDHVSHIMYQTHGEDGSQHPIPQ